MVGMYGVANLLQSIAAANTAARDNLDVRLLMRLAQHRTYVLGLVCQVLGFILAFLARRDLPLFLVQSSVAAGLGVTAVLGVLVLKWKLPKAEILLLVLLCAGLAGLVVAAEPHPSRQLGIGGIIGLLITLAAVGGGGTLILSPVDGSTAAGTALAGTATTSTPPGTGSVTWICKANGSTNANGAATAGTLLARYAPAACRT